MAMFRSRGLKASCLFIRSLIWRYCVAPQCPLQAFPMLKAGQTPTDRKIGQGFSGNKTFQLGRVCSNNGVTAEENTPPKKHLAVLRIALVQFLIHVYIVTSCVRTNRTQLFSLYHSTQPTAGSAGFTCLHQQHSSFSNEKTLHHSGAVCHSIATDVCANKRHNRSRIHR